MTEAFVQEFEARAGMATAEGPEWLEPVRRAAMERFARTGFPPARDEEWRFTPIAPIVQGSWRPAGREPNCGGVVPHSSRDGSARASSLPTSGPATRSSIRHPPHAYPVSRHSIGRC